MKAIKDSPNLGKEHLVTLMAIDKSLTELKGLTKVQASLKEKKFEFSGISAVPVSKKLPWMSITGIPEEFVQDVRDQKKP